MRVLLATLICGLVLACPASAGFAPGGTAPGACAGAFWTDLVGTAAIDLVRGGMRPERIYGLSDADVLIGSDTRASCLFGGSGSDALYLGRGGGVIVGEEGRDLLVGSAKSDALAGGESGDVILGGEGDDVLRGDQAVDAMDAGPGDDAILADDGNAEVIDCGAGADTVYADRADVLLGCEQWELSGPPLIQRRLDRSHGGRRSTFRAKFVSPEAAPPGRFRVLVAAPGCASGPLEVARSVGLRRGQHTRLRLRPPAGGWCPGAYIGTIVRSAPCPPRMHCPTRPPVEPLAWVAFVIRD